LHGDAKLDVQKVARGPMPKPPEETASAEQVSRGEVGYHRFCAVCHGFLVASAGIVPDLKYSSEDVLGFRKVDGKDVPTYKFILLDGELKDRGMASFADQLKM